ncbi:hypothetical protein CAPTEDRAFT_187662 [Capitella teleta]|uniref:FAD dependent oxidoreductase domain-containing protein n=1 Tax=Capitella teleta TaxID=283909 RepID=R7VGB3_CAPTE|nr:hypothetical protein CAPTEDRAFT_187662 [Capitella teleta]|eukprot:ELU17654.1 hypothetical protein CAPTEDRAFT_187662 [Capitella teleta]
MSQSPDGTVVVGGTYQVGDWNSKIDVKDREEILKNAFEVMPSLKIAPVIGEWVGQRPGRSEVRLELENVELNGKKIKVVHNYGHGGSGVGLSWGCAETAVGLVKRGIGCLSKI